MSTPLGHSLLGLISGQLVPPATATVQRQWLILSVVAGNAADLDFLPGLLSGDLNRYHHQASHSLLAALLVGILVWRLLAHRYAQAGRAGLLTTLAYCSHLLADYLTADYRPPLGIPLFWPFSPDYFLSPYILLDGVKHGMPGDSSLTSLLQILSWQNLQLLLMETA
ncbi:MAG TPA: metal-dependent hydrolase, partial [Gammaproteobacteria bacterium]|nr:metal-dependent hydrolase [Gammaproteobacteria bacterium]